MTLLPSDDEDGPVVKSTEKNNGELISFFMKTNI